MRRIGAMILVSALCGSANGCGTMANMDGRDSLVGWPTRPPIPFGGVANDLSWMKGGALETDQRYDRDFAFMIGFSDLPFSLLGDVVTLPWATFERTREAFSPTDRYDREKYKAGLDRSASPAKKPVDEDDD